MLLGGLRYLLPVINEAHKRGWYVITVDYIPDNIAHKYSDEYYNISTFDKEAILEVAKKIQINGILSFAVDAGVTSAAYVAEQMGLPFQCDYNSTCILQDKSLFRKFLAENGFNTPKAKGYDNVADAIKDVDSFTWPIMVKPVDSCGSKGVKRVGKKDEFVDAVNEAIKVSVSKHFIVEEFLLAEGNPSGSESFFVEGKLKYNAFYDQMFDPSAPNQFTPAIECWPSGKNELIIQEVKDQLQRLGNLLGFRTGLFNVEWRISNGRVYLMEVSPRAGGNRLAEILNYATDVDIIEAETIKSVGITPTFVKEPEYNGFYAIYNLHSDKAGIFKGIKINNLLTKHIVEKEVRVEEGTYIDGFRGANASLGTLFLRFSNMTEMNLLLNNICEYVEVEFK